MTGVESVDAFSDGAISLTVGGKKVLITGAGLKILAFSKGNGNFSATGEVSSVKYGGGKGGLKGCLNDGRSVLCLSRLRTLRNRGGSTLRRTLSCTLSLPFACGLHCDRRFFRFALCGTFSICICHILFARITFLHAYRLWGRTFTIFEKFPRNCCFFRPKGV